MQATETLRQETRVGPDAIASYANGITSLHLIGSIALIAALAADMPPSKELAASHILLSVLDKADGLTAKWEGSTNLGKRLDPFADKIHTVGAYGALAINGGVDPLMFGAIFGREAWAIGYREHAKRKGEHLPARRLAKMKTGAQFSDIAFRLSPIGAKYPELADAWTLGTTALTLYSGYDIVKGARQQREKKQRGIERAMWGEVVNLYRVNG